MHQHYLTFVYVVYALSPPRTCLTPRVRRRRLDVPTLTEMLKETDALKVFDKSGAGKLSYEDLTNVVDGDKEGQEQPRPPAPPHPLRFFVYLETLMGCSVSPYTCTGGYPISGLCYPISGPSRGRTLDVRWTFADVRNSQFRR